MNKNKIEYSVSSQIKNACKGCEMRIAGGDCHIFCPAYKAFQKELEKAKKNYQDAKNKADLAYNHRHGEEQPKATNIERMRKRKYRY